MALPGGPQFRRFARQEDHADVVARYLAGQGVYELAAFYAVAAATIEGVLRHAGVRIARGTAARHRREGA